MGAFEKYVRKNYEVTTENGVDMVDCDNLAEMFRGWKKEKESRKNKTLKVLNLVVGIPMILGLGAFIVGIVALFIEPSAWAFKTALAGILAYLFFGIFVKEGPND